MVESGDSSREIPAMIQEVLDEATASVEDLAREAGLSPHTLWAWAKERRSPRPESLQKLAEVLERRGGRMDVLAEKLRSASEESSS